ncbi:MAG TPA: carbon storage regulator [Planctomycetaceae bacterium]
MPVVISCRVQDEVRIGDSVNIVILEVAEDHVRLGVTSPHQVPEYQEQIVYLTGDGDEETDGTAEAGRQLVGA